MVTSNFHYKAANTIREGLLFYLFDNSDALRMSPLGRSLLFHLDKPPAALRQTPSLFAPFLVTMYCAGQENNVIGSTVFPPVLMCGPYGFAQREVYQN